MIVEQSFTKKTDTLHFSQTWSTFYGYFFDKYIKMSDFDVRLLMHCILCGKVFHGGCSHVALSFQYFFPEFFAFHPEFFFPREIILCREFLSRAWLTSDRRGKNIRITPVVAFNSDAWTKSEKWGSVPPRTLPISQSDELYVRFCQQDFLCGIFLEKKKNRGDVYG